MGRASRARPTLVKCESTLARPDDSRGVMAAGQSDRAGKHKADNELLAMNESLTVVQIPSSSRLTKPSMSVGPFMLAWVFMVIFL